MPDNLRLGLGQQNRNKHSAMAATFDNPSYFTISGQSPLTTATTPTDVVESIGAKPKRFKSWFKLPKKSFRSKVALHQPENTDRFSENSPPPGSPESEPQGNLNDFAHSDVVYYNFCSVSQDPARSTEVNNDDDVFSDTSTIRGIGSTRTLSRRRHSLGSWFRSSLAAVRKHNTGASTASGLESHDTATETTERPSTSSERALLARNVSTSVNCVSSASARDIWTPERGRSAEIIASKRRLPLAVKSHVELRARARYARQEKLARDSKAVSTSRMSRAVQSPHHRHQTASLDRRYTNSTEVLASKPEEGTLTSQQPAVPAVATPEQVEEEDSFQREESCPTRRKSISSTSRQRFVVQRSRTIEDRHRTSCCGRMAAAAASTSSRGERRRASFDAASPSSHTRRRCQRCRDKVEPTGAEKVDVVIIFSKNCLVAYQWIHYLSGILVKIFSSSDRPPTRVTSRDVESLVDSSNISPTGRHKPPPVPPSRGIQKCEYQNVATTEQSDAERSVRQHAVRKTVATASLQIVLLSKALLNHIGLHANDPLGTLLHPKRVLGLMLGVDEFKDVMPLHRSALCSFDYWPKIIMRDQDMNSVNEFGKLAQSILGRSQPVALVEANLQPARFKITPKKLRSGEERVTLILLETTENIQDLATVQVGIDLNKSDHVERLSWVNPYVVTFNVPRKFLERGIMIKVQLKVGNTSWGVRDLKCQNKLGEIAVLLSKCQLMGSPTEVMCQALNISPVDNEELDRVLTHSLDKAKVSLLAFGLDQPEDELRDEEYPTLLHFAARCGLKKLTWALLECIGAVQAIYIRNFYGLTALQLAEQNGHDAVINCLQSFIRTEAANKKGAANKNEAANNNEADFDQEIQNGDYVPIINSTAVVEKGISDYDTVPIPKLVSSTINEVSTKKNFPSEIEVDRGAIGGSRLAEEITSGKIHSTTKTGFVDEERQRITKKDNVINPILQRIPIRSSKDEETIPEATQQDNAFSSGSPFIVMPSRASSPLSNWSSSDRSSVASHLSHDSGTHFESSEERKVLGNIRNDYDVPPATVIVMPNYVVPPPPRPVDGREDEVYIPVHSQIRLDKDLSSKSSPRPPTMFRYPFETIELNLPASQAILGEDLGLIIPNGEPEFLEQAPILLPSYSHNDPSRAEGEQSVYMEMTPRCARKCFLQTTTWEENSISIGNVIEDNYVATSDLNMPTSYLASTSPRLKRRLALRGRECLQVSKNLSNSDNHLLANTAEAQISDWRSDPLLALPESFPIPAPRSLDVCGTPKVPPRTFKPTLNPCCNPKSNNHKI